MLTRTKASAGVLVAVIVTALAAGVAQAQAFDPTAGLTTMATDAATSMGPVILAIGGAFVALAIALWGVRFVLGAVRKGKA